MTFSNDDLNKIRDLLNLPPQSLFEGSTFRQRAKQIEDWDLQQGLTLVTQIQGYLTRIAQLEAFITNATNKNIGAVKSIDVWQEREIEYNNTQKDYNLEYRKEIQALIAKIAREFGTNIILTLQGDHGL